MATPPTQETGKHVNITATVTDNVAVDTVTVNITGPTTFAVEVMTNIPGTHTYYYNATYIEIGMYDYFIWAEDTSGNENTSLVKTFEIVESDTTPPVTTHNFSGTSGENGWYVSDVTVTLTAEDDLTGVAYTMYDLDGTGFVEYTSPIVVSDDGEHTLKYYSVDNAGNIENTTEVDLLIDQTVPTIILTAEKTGFRTWLLTANVSDETSGIAKVEFYVDVEFVGEVIEAPYELVYTGTGETAQAIAYDNAGNSKVSEEIDAVSQSHSQSQSQSQSATQVKATNQAFSL